MKDLITAVMSDDLLGVKKSIKSVENINIPLELEDCDNIFFLAVKYKADVDILKILVESGLDLSYVDSNGVGIFDEAMNYNDLSFIKYMVEEKGCDPSVTNRKSGFTPLMQAVSYGHLEIVKYLLQKGIDISKKDNFGLSSKDYARKLGQTKVLDYLKSL